MVLKRSKNGSKRFEIPESALKIGLKLVGTSYSIGLSLQLCSQFQRQLSLYILPPMRSPEVPIFNKTRMECKKFLASSSFFCFWVSEKSWCQRDVVAFSGKQALYYHALKASRSPPHICTCATVHAWLWQKISLETAAALEVEGRQTLCFLFTTEAQCLKISKIDSSKKMLSFFKYCSKQLILVLIFGGKNSNFENTQSFACNVGKWDFFTDFQTLCLTAQKLMK